LRLTTAVVAAGLVAAAPSTNDAPPVTPSTSATATTPTGRPPTRGPVAVASGWSLIATTKGTISRYRAAGGPPKGTIPATWHGGVSALPVINQEPGWLQVRLASRPNESTAWVRRHDAELTSTPYRIVINLARKHLQLVRSGQVVLDAAVGVGTPTNPTPTGEYFVAFFARPPSVGYGSFVMVTSAHSNTITDWEQSGDALVAIHGPLGADAAIGTAGAAISHGCIRLHLGDQTQLRPVPAGTPISIR
jgi:lipoprotein-anchoring transpeptidase ErfK/SrfK